jgi:hypothetical protein
MKENRKIFRNIQEYFIFLEHVIFKIRSLFERRVLKLPLLLYIYLRLFFVFLKYSTLLVIVSELPYNLNLPCLGSTFILEVYP